MNNNWGAMVRSTAYDGEKGVCNGCWFGPPIEKFYDRAILISRVISKSNQAKLMSVQTIASAGIGWVRGEELNDTRTSLDNMESVPGLAFELGLASMGSTIGYSISFIGNINGEADFAALMLSLTLGQQR